MSDSSALPIPSPASSPANQTNVETNQGVAASTIAGGLVIGHLTVYLTQAATATQAEPAAPTTQPVLGKNPYQGLKAFQEGDRDRFFGRNHLIHELHQQFVALYEDIEATRIMAIYGPSGSGKSSVARAGLIPEIGQHSLPGKETARLVVLTPGTDPLGAIATVLARIATNDPLPAKKARELKEELLRADKQQEYAGLKQIAQTFPDIDIAPLIIVVDQFEELYTLCTHETERQAFVRNLLCAASDRSRYVSVILTMRSDFLGATQQHPRLNALFASKTNGRLIPVMQREELEAAITQPAIQAGYSLDRGVVQALLAETQGQEGALPLLQFALTQIWQGLTQDPPEQPADTLARIGGVGGALANEAKSIYYALTTNQQLIARCIFLSLIQLNEDNKATRRRARLSELINSHQSETEVRTVIDRFSRPGVWILVTSSNQESVEMVEIAHEALIRNWQELQDWLKEQWQAIRQKRKLEEAANEWIAQKKAKDNLLSGKPLREAKDFLKIHQLTPETSLSAIATTFIHASQQRQRQIIFQTGLIFLIIPALGTLVPIHFFLLNLAQKALTDKDVECKQNREVPILLQYMFWTGQKSNLEEIVLCNDLLTGFDFSHSSLWKANFRQAQLGNVNFQGSLLREADFESANLREADFSFAKLQNAKFKYSLLYKTNLSLAEGVEDKQLEKAALCHTLLPPNSKLKPDRDCQKLGLF